MPIQNKPNKPKIKVIKGKAASAVTITIRLNPEDISEEKCPMFREFCRWLEHKIQNKTLKMSKTSALRLLGGRSDRNK